MYGTIENTHIKITEKVSLIRRSLESIRELSGTIRSATCLKVGKKFTECLQNIDSLRINFTLDLLDTLESNYHLSIIGILSDYYQNAEREDLSGAWSSLARSDTAPRATERPSL